MDEERAAALAKHLVDFRQQHTLSAFHVIKTALQVGYGLALEDAKKAADNTDAVIDQIMSPYNIEAATR